VALLLAGAAGGWGMDLATMPLPELKDEGQYDATYYYVKLSPEINGSRRMHLFSGHYGLSREVEASIISVSGPYSFTAINAGVRLAEEKENNGWQVVLGVVNLFGDNYFRSDKASPYVVASKLIDPTAIPPTPKKPAVRPFVGYGSNTHDGWFGGVRLQLAPRTTLTAASYGHQPVYALQQRLRDERNSPVFALGTLDGNPFFSLTGIGWYWY